MYQHKVNVAAAGMITAIGVDVPMTATAIKAQINKYQLTDYVNKRLKRMKAAFVPESALPPLKDSLLDIPKLSSRYKRMLQMSEPALLECLQKYPSEDPLPLFLACPESLPGSPSDIDPQIIKHIKIQTDAVIDLENSRLLTIGRAGGLHALDLACRYFDATGKDFALVGGIDACRYALHQLGTLDRDNRMSADGVLDAYAPGEAAGFVLLVAARAAEKYNLTATLKLYSPGFGSEQGHLYSDAPYKGEGLAEAFKQAIANSPGQPVENIYASVNGESYWNKEFGVAVTRNSQSLKDNYGFEHPCDCFGDIGAAFAPVMLGVLGESFKGKALCYCSSDSEYRSAVYISA